MASIDVFGVRVDKITAREALSRINGWLEGQGRHYVVTPNIEFIMAAQDDPEFAQILNQADLSIPDSSRLGWVQDQLEEQNFLIKLLKWPFFLFPKALKSGQFPVVTGTDLMEALFDIASKQNYSIGLLGGQPKVAAALKQKMLEKYPNLQIKFASGQISVNYQGQVTKLDPDLKEELKKPIDLLFVAFGQRKQEKWISQNMPNLKVKVAMGVGGGFDYLSGAMPRAPYLLRLLGFEWLFRLIIQPGRAKRFVPIIKFTLLVLFN